MSTERTSLLPRASSRSLHAPPRRLKWKRKLAAGVALVLLRMTAAISYPNGTTVNIAKVSASTVYKAAMARLFLDSSTHPQYARKEAGLPSSWDVGHLATLILALRSKVEKYLGRKISGAIATVPHSPAIYSEDLFDAFEYAGLIYIPQDPYWWGDGIFPETCGAYFANGFGICTNYTDIPSCREEQSNPDPQETVLSISYSSTWLISTISAEGSGFMGSGVDSYINVKTDIGWEQRNQNPDVEYYWEAVRKEILRPVLQADRWGKVVAKVMIYGEHAMDERFQDLVKDLVLTAFKVPPVIFQLDPTFAAARGAAEIAKRISWRFNHTEISERRVPVDKVVSPSIRY